MLKSDASRSAFYPAGVTAQWHAHRNQKRYWCVARIDPESGAIEYYRSTSGVIVEFHILATAYRKAHELAALAPKEEPHAST